MLLCLLLNLIIQFLSLGNHGAELCFLCSGIGCKQEESVFLMADLSSCPGLVGDGPFRVTQRMLLAKWTLHHCGSGLEKGKQGEVADIWDGGAVHQI